MKSQAEVGEQIVEIDTEAMENRLKQHIDSKIAAYHKEVKEWKSAKEPGGKGVVEAFMPTENKAAVIEEFKKGEACDPVKIKEQWTIAVPKYARYELAGHLRDYVWVTDVVKGRPGETVNIPYVKDVEFEHVVPMTGTFTAKTALVNVLTTTLKEAGAYYDAYYGDIEKIDANMLDELNRVFAHAAIRAEDKDLLILLDTASTGQFASMNGTTNLVAGASPDCGTVTATYFHASFIADAIGQLLLRGKEVHPGECVLYMTARNYRDLIKEIMGSQALSYARSDAVQKGVIEDFLGVKIIVGGKKTHHLKTTSTYEISLLFRPKRALALAPKRDILIETDKLIATRQLRIAASHTFGVAAIDLTECVRIWSSYKWKSANP